MKIAIVHDFLREYGGAERVVEAMHEIWPEAPLYTSFVDWKSLGDHAKRFKGWDIRTSWVQDNWVMRKFHSPLRFLAPQVWESFDLSDYDVVITSSGWFIDRGVITKRGPAARQPHVHPQGDPVRGAPRLASPLNGALHICYIHHPPRNLYGYATGSNLQKYWPVKVYSTVVNFFLRHYDFETAQRVDYFIANSKETARRVQKFYRRDSTVIYPPVEVNPKFEILNSKQIRNSKSQKEENRRGYYVSVGRLTWAKRVDFIIQAANRLKLPLKIVGKGKEETYLRSIAGPTVEFVGGVSDEELSKLYAGAKALIFCALDEDFGIVPVEAMTYGTPVVALAQGGVVETVIDGKTGVLFKEAIEASLVEAIQRLEDSKTVRWEENCIKQAKKFSKERFQKELKTFVEEKYGAQ